MRLAGLVLWGTVVALGSGAPVRPAALAGADLTLDRLFSEGAILEDRNTDGIVDFVNTRPVVPEVPSPSDIVAGAELAARLGYETTAMDLPVVVPALS